MTDSVKGQVCVHKTSGDFDAQQVKAFLEAHGIHCILKGEALRNTHGFTLDGLGVVRIMVAADDEEAARELLEKAESGQLAVDEDSEPDAG